MWVASNEDLSCDIASQEWAYIVLVVWLEWEDVYLKTLLLVVIVVKKAGVDAHKNARQGIERHSGLNQTLPVNWWEDIEN